jgi:hypothetical protein
MGSITKRFREESLMCFEESSKLSLGFFLIPQIAFPDNQGTPTQPSQLFKVFLIASPVPRNFFDPVLTIILRNACTASATVSMPKAAMHKDSLLGTRENQIRFTGKIFTMQPKTITHTMSQAPDKKFRGRVVTFHGPHGPAAQLRRFRHHSNIT